jgi:predicted transcriptional regulator
VIDLREPLLQVAARDRTHVSDLDYRVLTIAVPLLSEDEPREMKLEVLAAALRMDKGQVSRAVKRLMESGFLIRVDRADSGGAWRYRLPRSPVRIPTELTLRQPVL